MENNDGYKTGQCSKYFSQYQIIWNTYAIKLRNGYAVIDKRKEFDEKIDNLVDIFLKDVAIELGIENHFNVKPIKKWIKMNTSRNDFYEQYELFKKLVSVFVN